MSANKISAISEFRKNILAANKEATKKELFKDLLNRLFSHDEETKKVIDAISVGAETSILNIPRQDKKHRGSADTLYNRIIIEFENDLKKSLNHAKEQLAGYLLGQFHSGEGYNFTLIVSDFVNWKVFAPDVSQLNDLNTLKEDELILNEVESASFKLTEHNGEEFYYWIDRFLFKDEKQKATLRRIEEAFGYQSKVFIEAFREMSAHFQTVKDSGEVQVSFEQWHKFLSIAYGGFERSENDFLIHTYLSVFSKMLAYTVLSNDDYIDETEARGIVDGSIFQRFNIENFVENDFFHWVKNDASFRALKKTFRLIAQELSAFDFRQVDEDILKGVYQELIDLDTRHALGEYYTPDWLCERIVNEFNFKTSDKILDPSCGSGSFLRAAIARLKKLHPEATAEDINNQIYGIDVHPLSVQIAKTTLLLALGDEIKFARQPVNLKVILANTLLEPQGIGLLHGKEFLMDIDRAKVSLTVDVFKDTNLFDEALNICEDLAEQTHGKIAEQPQTFANILKIKNGGDLSEDVTDSFYKIYQNFKTAKDNNRDSIWKFVVQNSYKPYLLEKKFDYVIGNPPWFTYSSIRNEKYQNVLDLLAKEHNVKPAKQANYPHLEIAAIFLAFCSKYFLKEVFSQIAFVIPRSFFSADHHDNTRSGKAAGFTLTSIWDLKDVAPLFRVPSGVLFGKKSFVNYPLPEIGLDGKTFRGALSIHNCNLVAAEPLLTEDDVKWFYVKQGSGTAFSSRKPTGKTNVNPYKKLFKQGATIVPRAFYFVELNQAAPPDFVDRTINVKTAVAIQPDSKKPWDDIELSGRIESRFLFRTALSKSILPFALHNPNLVVLPLTIEQNDFGQKQIKLHSADELRQAGFLNASRWFRQVEEIWTARRTEKNQNISSENYLNWQNKITEQNLNVPYLVLYNSSAKDANATVVRREDFNLEYFVDYTGYWFSTNAISEAYYLATVFNSALPNKMMKDFQARGLFGARHVSKKILDVYFPRFNAADTQHKTLAELGEAAHRKAMEYLTANPPHNDLSATRLGKLRLDIKRHLTDEMRQIDLLVEKLLA